MIPSLSSLSIPLDDYPKLSAWVERLMQRETWQKTQPSSEVIEVFIPQMETLIKTQLAK